MSEAEGWHLGRYTKPGEFTPCALCGVSRLAENLEDFGGRKICTDRITCERWIVLRAEKGGKWK